MESYGYMHALNALQFVMYFDNTALMTELTDLKSCGHCNVCHLQNGRFHLMTICEMKCKSKYKENNDNKTKENTVK